MKIAFTRIFRLIVASDLLMSCVAAVGAFTSYSANAFDASGALIGSLQGISLFKR